MNAEKIKKTAIIEYAVRELNNIIDSARAEKIHVNTSRSYMYAMELYETDTLDAMSIKSGTMEIVINKPFAVAYPNTIGIADNESAGSYVELDIETVLGWLEQLQKD